MMARNPSPETFGKSFTQQEQINEEAVAAAVEILQSGRLHRYNTIGDDLSQVALLEQEYAAYQGAQFCLAVASGGQALQIALRALGLRHGEPVLANAYTLAPVPGAIHAVGGVPILVEIDRNWHIDLVDLRNKAKASGAKKLLLSHMRGHIADMEAIMAICNEFDITLLEDCAHTMGARWNGIASGNFGAIACFSTQTYKHLNSGEGGLVTTNDPELAARATICSGSYMLYGRHGAGPPEWAYAGVKLQMPNCSSRMDNLRAAILRPQLRGLDANIERWNARYRVIEAELNTAPGLFLPERAPHECFVGSSIQFHATGFSRQQITALVAECGKRGVELKWFGNDVPTGFTSRFDSWAYLGDPPDLPQTLASLSSTLDMRIPLTFSLDDCALIARIIRQTATQIGAPAKADPSAIQSGVRTSQ